ncbi:MAG: translation initiation factor IF-2 [Dehalococcoidia bacterium]|nr:translation initiation factor IF-2 [Dehalococcoidia bacterium]MDP6226886.1 translation initiation factor IF-2 [Dehalococcoidia bacterium]MDP7083496.1 translation initiation factor IF-2 [Dehalococcoidia bacterium]MDP7199409.1 translation initiation factor IF-2 [Dehalococcoidia bacterium]MDP7509462.1 translation initiation factor IF-2 [Dehalococcoidia bacterium]
MPQTLTVQRLAELSSQNPIDIIKQLMRNGIMASMNQVIDYQVATLVTAALGIHTTLAETSEPEAAAGPGPEEPEDQASLSPRPPVVTILGHVDHGKTSLLDTIRRTRVAEREVGGITQHIGAYQVECQGQLITFLDTPGHEAFTAIRARGAKITDIAVLVVAADDGLMPQSVEAINHAKAAGVSIVVAINKMDLPGADPERVKRQLSEQELLVEDWGGDVISVQVSARTGDGIDDLLENLLVVAELAELKANQDRPATGVVIEARLDRKRGPTATVLVQDGTLKVGDQIVAGNVWGRIKAINNYQGKPVKSVMPAEPGEILGFGAVPEAGDLFSVVANERAARATVGEREKIQSIRQGQTRALTLDEIVKQIDSGDVKELKLVLKADVQGSVEAVRQALEGMGAEEAMVRILHTGCGSVTESDVMLASASKAVIFGFTVGTESSAERLAERMGVEIRRYDIIYQLIDDVDRGLHGMLDPVQTDVVVGRAEIRELFSSRRGAQIAGCRVTEGRVNRGANVRIMRDGQVVHETTIASLRHFRDEVTEMTAGSDCGITLQGFNDFQEGDIVEAHRLEAGRR